MRLWLGLIGSIPLLLLTAAGAASVPTSNSVTPRVFLMDGEYLRAAQQRIRNGDKSLAPAVAELERDAKAALDAGPFSVMEKTNTPPSGDKHDYMSIGP